jgi:hypothetical protein
MAIIPNFPQNLLDMHHHWHDPSAHPGSPGTRVHPFGTAGAGLEFLQFHRDFMAQVMAWYNAQPFGTAPFNVAPFQNLASAQAAVAGWTFIPAPLKNGAVTGWGGVQVAQEARLTSLTPPFASADDLGTYIEGGIHGWIHGAAAAAFNEPIVGTFHSPLSTYFYGIHGLVDLWWRNWQATQKSRLKDIVDIKAPVLEKLMVKELKEHKEFVKEHKEILHDKHPLEKVIKDKDKDIIEGGIPGGGGDPAFMQGGDIVQRLSDLEVRMSQQAFIQPSERPMVGDAARINEERKKK